MSEKILVLLPAADGFYQGSDWIPFGTPAPTKWEAWLPTDPLHAGAGGPYPGLQNLNFQQAATSQRQSAICRGIIPNDIQTINKIRVAAYMRPNHRDTHPHTFLYGLRTFAGLEGDITRSSFQQTPWPQYTQEDFLSRPGGGNWLPSDLADLELYFAINWDGFDWGNYPIFHSAWLEVFYLPQPGGASQQQEAMSRRLWMVAQRDSQVKLEVPLAFPLKVDFLDEAQLSHWAGITAEGQIGWGFDEWERTRLLIEDFTYRPDQPTAVVSGRAFRTTRILMRDTMISRGGAGGQNGVARVLPRVSAYEFNRDGGSSWVQGVDGLYRLISLDTPIITTNGQLFSHGQVNELLESSYFNAATGWTLNTRARIVVPTIPIFEASTNNNCLELYQSGGQTGIATSSWTAALEADDFAAFVIFNLTGIPALTFFHISIERQSDGFFWDPDLSTWGAIDPLYSPVAETQVIVRLEISNIPVALNDSLRLTYTLDGGGNSASVEILHSEIRRELASFASLLVTQTTTATEGDSLLRIISDAGTRVYLQNQGAIGFDWVPLFTSAEFVGEGLDMVLWEHHSSDLESDRLNYHMDTETLQFIRRKAGADVIVAAALFPVVEQTRYRIGVRRIGPIREWGRSPNSVSVWINSEEVAEGNLPTAEDFPLTGAWLSIGSRRDDAGVWSDFGFSLMAMFQSVGWVPSDARMRRFPNRSGVSQSGEPVGDPDGRWALLPPDGLFPGHLP